MTGFLMTAAFCFASVFVFTAGVSAAGDSRLLTVKPAARDEKVKPSEKTGEPAAAGVKTGEAYAGFDEFNNLNDPLYRDGSKAMLEKANSEDKAANTSAGAASKAYGQQTAKSAVKAARGKPELMRDAPADLPLKAGRPVSNKNNDAGKTPALRVKKSKSIKIVPVDPVNSKSTL